MTRSRPRLGSIPLGSGSEADGRDKGDLTIARRFFAHATASQRGLIAYWQSIKRIEQERLCHHSADAAP